MILKQIPHEVQGGGLPMLLHLFIVWNLHNMEMEHEMNESMMLGIGCTRECQSNVWMMSYSLYFEIMLCIGSWEWVTYKKSFLSTYHGKSNHFASAYITNKESKFCLDKLLGIEKSLREIVSQLSTCMNLHILTTISREVLGYYLTHQTLDSIQIYLH